MAQIRVTHSIDDLASDLRTIALEAPLVMARTVREEARLGNALAQGFARKSAGTHGKHYPSSMSAEMVSALSWEYGPESDKPQGGMSFERGSRNQPYHGDLDKSADIIVTRLGPAVLDNVDSLFWPGA